MFAIEIFCQEDIRICDMICRYGEQVFQGENNIFQAVRITQKLLMYSQRFVQGLGLKYHILDQLHSSNISLE